MKDNEGNRYGMKKNDAKKEKIKRKLWNKGFGTETPISQLSLNREAYNKIETSAMTLT
jgi:hypothetical protein